MVSLKERLVSQPKTECCAKEQRKDLEVRKQTWDLP